MLARHLRSRTIPRLTSRFASRTIHDRVVALWGNGDFGRLGLAHQDSRLEPSVCSELQDCRPLAVACGGAHTLILTDQGAVFSTGLNDCGQLGVSLDVPFSPSPVRVPGLPEGCVQVAAGSHHSAAVSDSGELFVWGANGQGQLGLGSKAPSALERPAKVEGLVGVEIRGVALGGEHSLCLAASGELLAWGSGRSGQLGHGEDAHAHRAIFRLFQKRSCWSPRLVKAAGLGRVVRVSAGLMHSACVDEEGVVFTFGQGRFSQLGQREDADQQSPKAVLGLGLAMAEVACGGYHTGAVSRSGDLYMWGSNEYGCLGVGYGGHSRVPVRVGLGLGELSVESVACGWKHSAAITDDGQIFTWGWGGSQGTYAASGQSSGGQLGHRDEFDYLEPTKLDCGGLAGIQISCGFNHTGAVLGQR